MSDLPPEEATPAAEQKYSTIGDLILAVEPTLTGGLNSLSEMGRQGAVAADADVRRGLVAMNGAGLVAVISILSHSLDGLAVRTSVALYFLGLAAGLVSWVHRTRSHHSVMMIDLTIGAALQALKDNPVAKLPMKTKEDVEAVTRVANKVIDQTAKQLKKVGQPATRWSLTALGCFFAATAILVADFEVRGSAEASFVKAPSPPSSPQVPVTASPRRPIHLGT